MTWRLPGVRFTLSVAALSIAAAVSATSAHAEFGPIQLVSKSTSEQADEASYPALSGGGGYVAFVGQLGGRDGIFRKDLRTGAIALVVEFSTGEEKRSARPSISADGRYVAFTTRRQLDPGDDLQASSNDVYVADMSTTPPTYELVSALDHCDPRPSEPESQCGLTYLETGAQNSGAVAAGRVALSADGRSVAFLTTAPSDLTTADPKKLETPAGQVAVRRLETHETILITEPMDSSGPVPGGGADPNSEGAAISGDGSTVAWVGRHLPGQVPMLPDEEAAVRTLEEGGNTTEPEKAEYHEPLWRRIPGAIELDPQTRRIVGGGDPLALGCPPGGTREIPACQGPFPNLTGPRQRNVGIEEQEGRGWGIKTPQLDRDGDTVELVGNPDEDADLYVVNMAPGLSRRDAVRRLTQWVNPVPGAEHFEQETFEEKFTPVNGPILSAAISADGNRIAFTTTRQFFPLVPPTLVTAPGPGVDRTPEIFQLDLDAETIERLLPGGGMQSWEGSGGIEGEAPSYSENGLLLGFASTASDLVEGDTNQAPDVFTVESPPPSSADETAISRRPSQISVIPLWRMTANASSLRNGTVRVVVGLPGAGALRAKARARLGRRLKRRQVGGAHRQAGAAGVQRLTLRLPRKLRGLARRKGGLNAEVDLDFSSPGGKPLSAALDVRFVVHGKKPKKGKKR